MNPPIRIWTGAGERGGGVVRRVNLASGSEGSQLWPKVHGHMVGGELGKLVTNGFLTEVC